MLLLCDSADSTETITCLQVPIFSQKRCHEQLKSPIKAPENRANSELFSAKMAQSAALWQQKVAQAIICLHFFAKTFGYVKKKQ